MATHKGQNQHMAFISLHSVPCKYSPGVFRYSQQQSYLHQDKRLTESAHIHLQKVTVVSFSRAGAFSFKVSPGFSQLWCLIPSQPSVDLMLWHDMAHQRDTEPKADTASEQFSHSSTGAQDWLASSARLHSSVLPNFWKSSRTAVNTFTPQNSITAPEIRSLLKF